MKATSKILPWLNRPKGWTDEMVQEAYDKDHPDLDYEKVKNACLYAIKQLQIADEKEKYSSHYAEEIRSMAYRKLREAIVPE